jgi:predicted NAD/FAD-dependent oxidoreductase
MLNAFKKILQSGSSHGAATQLEHAINEYIVHRWRYADCDKFSQSGYGWDVDQNIGLCGDWLNGGKVQGAWISGYRLAQKVIHHV